MSLGSFTEFTYPLYETAPHQALIDAKLEAVERGEIKRLMIRCPPRHGKSEKATIRFPAWFLGRNPSKQIICASYNTTLATKFGRAVRNLVDSREFAAVFPHVKLAADSKAADMWGTAQGGSYVACGVRSSMTGHGAHLLTIDDPVKNREEADSETVRDAVREWYSSTARTRLMPGGAIVLIYTPWHEDDLGGWLLEEAEHGGEQWDVVSMPAMAEDDDVLSREPGQALWPAWYDRSALKEIKSSVSPRDWAALYQCRPIPEGGNFFERKWFEFYDDPPKHLRTYGASDFALGDNEEADFTVHGVVGVDANDTIYLLDLWRDKVVSDRSVDAMIDMILQYRPLTWGGEKGQIEKSLGPFIDKRMRERNAYCRRVLYARPHDKVVMARSFQARMSMGKVVFPRSAPWFLDLHREMLSFPAGKHDDQVDMLALIGMMMENMVKAIAPDRVQPQAVGGGFDVFSV